MNISLQNVDKVSAVLTVQIGESVEDSPQESEYAGFPSGNGAHDSGEKTLWHICIGRRS